MVKLNIKKNLPFVFIKHLASGVTSHVFSGIWITKNKHIKVAVKWLPIKIGIKEYITTKYLRQKLGVGCLKEHHLLLPIFAFSRISLQDLTKKTDITHIISILNLTQGPMITKRGKFYGKAEGMILIYPLMDGDLTQKVKIHKHNLIKDIKSSLKALNMSGVKHNDIELRNVMFRDDNYYIGDFGSAKIVRVKKNHTQCYIPYITNILLGKLKISY